MAGGAKVVVVGGGQAGLATAHELLRRGVGCMVLEAEPRVGEQWRRRWDSLRLFTPARFSGLPGSRFPAPAGSYPDKEQVATYLESYAASLPVRTGVRVLKLERAGRRYRLQTSAGQLEADHVVVANGNAKPRVPEFAAALGSGVLQMHAAEYQRTDQLSGDVLVAGAGTSGVEIAVEAARAGHRTVLAGRGTGRVPPPAYAFGGRPFMFFARRIATTRTPVGRALRPLVLRRGAPLIQHSMDEALAAGVDRAGRVAGAEADTLLLEDGRRVRPGTVVWCTGFTRDLSWIALPLGGDGGFPNHESGVVPGEPGLYFVGLPFQSRLASAFIAGAADDARHIAATIARRLAARELGQADQVEQPGVPVVEVPVGHHQDSVGA